MTEQGKEQMLQELLGSEELEQTRASTLTRGLREMRGRRRRATFTKAAVVIVPGVLILVLQMFFSIFPPLSSQHSPEPKPVALVVAPGPEPKIEYITTEQLFAMFPNRPLALIGKPGHRQVVFLDEHPIAVSQQ
jgi:hypothetical protein